MSDDVVARFGDNDAVVHSDGRVTIDSHKRARYGVEHRDAVNVTFTTEDDEEFTIDYLMVGGDGEVRIPGRLRGRLLGIEDGEYVDMDIELTSKTYPE